MLDCLHQPIITHLGCFNQALVFFLQKIVCEVMLFGCKFAPESLTEIRSYIFLNMPLIEKPQKTLCQMQLRTQLLKYVYTEEETFCFLKTLSSSVWLIIVPSAICLHSRHILSANMQLLMWLTNWWCCSLLWAGSLITKCFFLFGSLMRDCWRDIVEGKKSC